MSTTQRRVNAAHEKSGVSTAWGQAPIDTRLYGVEVELENFNREPEGNKYWSVTTDGSLRNNGYEIISKPFPFDKLIVVGQSLANILEGKGCEANHRCGLHVHTNFLNADGDDLRAFLITYLALEPLLFEVSGERCENLFCVPIVGSDVDRREFHKFFTFKTNSDYLALQKLRCKYQALNWATLWEHGTIEFRHMHGSGDWQEIGDWITLIHRLRDFAENGSWEVVYHNLFDIQAGCGYTEFLTDFLAGTRWSHWATDEKYHRKLRVGIREMKRIVALGNV